MTEYENKCCPCCGNSFTENDDIVVCPECGTPMHRACWSGHCPNESRHAEGFDWNKEQAKVVQTPTGENILRCEICGFKIANPDDKLFCPDCGSPMHKSCYERTGRCPHQQEHALGYDYHNAHGNTAKRSTTPNQPQFDTVMSFDELMSKLQENPMRNPESGEEITCFGVKQNELLHFLGTRSLSTPQFFSKFMNMARTGKKVSLNFFAGVFMPFYQFYRKMTGPAIILTLAYFIMNIPQLFLQVMFFANGYDALIPTQLESIYSVMTYVGLALEILLILFNDYIYMKWSVGKILTLREQYQNASESEYFEALERAGKPRIAFAFAALAAVGVLTIIAVSILGRGINGLL